MESMTICIVFKSGRVLERVYVRVKGVNTLLAAVGHFVDIWVSLCQEKRFLKHEGYVFSIEDADCLCVIPDYTVSVD